MEPQISEDIVAAWRALADESAEFDGWRSISILNSGTNRIFAARQFPNNAEALLFEFPSVALPQTNQLIHASGFKVERATINGSSTWLSLVRQPTGRLDIFSRMSADLLSVFASADASDQVRLLQVFLGRIRSWQEFMRKDGASLGLEAELGLAGELECLNLLLDSPLQWQQVIDGWKGPKGGLQDFELGIGAVEVKSTLSTFGFPAKVISLEQLDDSVRQPLFVCGCRFLIAEDGITLTERIQTLRTRLSSEPVCLASFNSAIRYVGYDDEQSDKYTRKFRTLNKLFVLVDENFPRLTSSNVPDGVRNATYEIDLEYVTNRQFSIEEVIEMIGMV